MATDTPAPPFTIVFFGTSDFAVPILKRLCHWPECRVAVVVTQPDRPSGRGRHPGEPPVKRAARELDVCVLQPERIRSGPFPGQLKVLQPHFFVVAAYGRILPAHLLRIPSVAPVNVHASLLPKYRGAAPIQRALMDGVEETGVTLMWMNERMDEGDILAQKKVRIGLEDTGERLMQELSHIGAEMLPEVLTGLARGNIHPIPQDHAAATYAPPITPRDSIVIWTEPARKTHNRVRALVPRPGTYTTFRGKRLKILTTWPHPDEAPTAPAGTVQRLTSDTVTVATGAGTLDLKTVHPEGSRVMTAGEWARGARVQPGDAFDHLSPDDPP